MITNAGSIPALTSKTNNNMKNFFKKRVDRKKEIKSTEEEFLKLISPVHDKYDLLVQPWHDGWLFHLYLKGGAHIRTIASHDLQTCIEKTLLFKPQ